MWNNTDKPFTRRAVKIAIIASCGVGVVGVGTVALAAAPSSGSTPTSSTATTSPTTGPAKNGDHLKARKAALKVKNFAHATWVSKDGKTGTFVTHDAIHGTVSAVSATSIQVKAADGDVETYAVSPTTKVHVRADGKAKAGTVSEVKTGDTVIVTGTGTTTLSANRILDLAK